MKLPIMLFSKQTRRRSLLRSARPGRKRLSFWKTVAISVGMMLFVIAAVAIFEPDHIQLSSVLVGLVEGILFCVCIAGGAFYGARIVERYLGNRPIVVQGFATVISWMLSGFCGSMLAYGLIGLIFPNVDRPPVTVMARIALNNGTVAVVLGVIFFLIRVVLRWIGKRTALIRQQSLLTAEFEAARSVQRSLLPAEDAHIPGFDISGATDPAVEIGGDYYDYLTLAGGSNGILVADAAGKEIAAARVMAKFQGMTQALSIHSTDTLRLLRDLNDTLRIRLARKNFITVGIITIAPDGECAFHRAGHNGLLLWRAATGEVEICQPPGMALGLADGNVLERSLQPAHFTMATGDIAMLYSDGLTEASGADGEYGEERVIAALRQAAATEGNALGVQMALFGALAEYVEEADPHDDVTVVIVRKVGDDDGVSGEGKSSNQSSVNQLPDDGSTTIH
ncbi:MAG: SpoIIE family protein phosphatase [Bacteroidota bacterium]